MSEEPLVEEEPLEAPVQEDVVPKTIRTIALLSLITVSVVILTLLVLVRLLKNP